MNFVNGSVKNGQVSIAALSDMTFDVDMALPADTRSVTVGLRPQILAIYPAKSELSVELSERLGGVSYDYLRTPTGERLVVESRGDAETSAGTEVEVEFEASAALLFDPGTGQRLT